MLLGLNDIMRLLSLWRIGKTRSRLSRMNSNGI